MNTKGKVNQPSTVRVVPNGTSSFAVGGWIGPVKNKRSSIKLQPQYLPSTTAATAANNKAWATMCAFFRSSA